MQVVVRNSTGFAVDQAGNEPRLLAIRLAYNYLHILFYGLQFFLGQFCRFCDVGGSHGNERTYVGGSRAWANAAYCLKRHEQSVSLPILRRLRVFSQVAFQYPLWICVSYKKIRGLIK